MKKVFQLCHDCRIIGAEVGNLFIIYRKQETCAGCSTYTIVNPTQPVEVEVEPRGADEKRDFYEVTKDLAPDSKPLRDQVNKLFEKEDALNKLSEAGETHEKRYNQETKHIERTDH